MQCFNCRGPLWQGRTTSSRRSVPSEHVPGKYRKCRVAGYRLVAFSGIAIDPVLAIALLLFFLLATCRFKFKVPLLLIMKSS